MNIKDFQHDDWVKIWDGGWSLLSCTHFGDEYTKEIIFGGKPFQSQSIMFAAHGRSSGWMRQTDRDRLGKHLSQEVTDRQTAILVAKRLKTQAKDFLQFIGKHENTIATLALYEDFWQRLCVYYKEHINVKYVVDYLEPSILEKYLPIFEDARLAAETVLNRSEDFMIGFAKLLAPKTKYDYTLLLCLTKEEMKDHLQGGELPQQSELVERDKRAALIHNAKSYQLFVGKGVNRIEKIVHTAHDQTEIKGVTAFAGKVSGIARIVNDPQKVTVFDPGDILVSGATRPDFLPLMHKAAAFVTDAGGILSHAAITAREMKKPCVIGTRIATKVLKDGDMVEVDANKGVVKKITT